MRHLPDPEPSSTLGKVVAFISTMVLFGLTLMFSVVLFAVVLTVGTIVWGYIWLRTRELRKQMRMHPPDEVVIQGEVIEGEVIEGEVVREDDTSKGK